MKILTGAGAFAAGWALMLIAAPSSFSYGLTLSQLAIELFGSTWTQWLGWFVVHACVGVGVIVVCAFWMLRTISIGTAALFGALAGAYACVLLPPVDLFGSVIDMADRLSAERAANLFTLGLSVIILLSAFPLLALLCGRLLGKHNSGDT